MIGQTALLGLLAQTSIHAGTGRQTGVVDLPIQREGHNGWPCVYGSAVKGALRARMEQEKLTQLRATDMLVTTDADYQKQVQNSAEIAVVFGPPPGEVGNKHAGALMVSDARLLLFPVRSLTSQFKWVTCPAALRRFCNDCALFNVPLTELVIPDLKDTQEQSLAWVSAAVIHDKHLFLEEYRFQAMPHDLSAWVSVLATLIPDHNAALSLLEKQLVIVSDDSFAHIVHHATPVNAHIAIDTQTKTVRDGQLWYEETLPPETLMYLGLTAHDARRADATLDAEQVLGHVQQSLTTKPWLQVGGNETVGMGWCAVSAFDSATALTQQKESV